MAKLKTAVAVTAGKTVAALTSFLKLGSGTSLPGKVARKVDRQLLKNLGSQVNQQVIAVTGTNGKTTTCGLLARFLTESGQSIVHNQLGANMVPGITAALLKSSSLTGKLKADYAVLEVDEASMKGVATELGMNSVLVTNLFRDQLDRYGELDTTARLIGEGIAQSSQTLQAETRLILNADDPLVTGLGRLAQQPPLYFGIDQVHYKHPVATTGPVPFTREMTGCPNCNGPLEYKGLIFGHLGHYRCLHCDYHRPSPAVVAEDVYVSPEDSRVRLRYGQEILDICLPLPGLFNVYNLLAAAAVALEVGLPADAILKGVANYGGVFGRAEKKRLQDRNVLVMLIKNPVGASEVLKLVGGDPKGRLLIALNDNYADGRDVSWIWDAQFEALVGDSADTPAVDSASHKTVMVSGERAADMAVRLKYAGFSEEKLLIEPDLKTALDKALSQTQPDEVLYILPTYTALLNLRKICP
jgi:lipid II isoglutaminyl synthase (glutamine-hydrolysing)